MIQLRHRACLWLCLFLMVGAIGLGSVRPALPYVSDDLDFAPMKQKQARPGNTWMEPITGMEFVWLPGGCFEMGMTEKEKQISIQEHSEYVYKRFYSNSLPQHEVCVDGFWMGKYEVTKRQFRKFVQASGYKTDAEKNGSAWIFYAPKDLKLEELYAKELAGYDWKKAGYSQDDNHPVVNVSWNDATAFARWLSREINRKFRLPSEAEWEYAARAGTASIRYWGDKIDERACSYANVADKGHNWSPSFPCNDGYNYTAPAGSYKPNPFGLYDMLGNVWEWCADWYGQDYYSRSPRRNPPGPSSGSSRVKRGGSWSDNPNFVRAAYRISNGPGTRSNELGFRLALSPGQ